MNMVRREWSILREASIDFVRNGFFNLASSISFHFVLSAVPFLFVIIYTFGRALGSSDELVHTVVMFLKVIRPHFADHFRDELKDIARFGNWLTWVSIGLFFVTTGLISQSLGNAFAIVFKAKKRHSFVRVILTSVILVPLFEILAFFSALMITVIKIMNRFQLELNVNIGKSAVSSWIELGLGYFLPFSFMIALFTAAYIFLAPVRVKLKHAFLGGILGSFLWIVAIHLITDLALISQRHSILLDSFKTFTVALVSLYYSASVLLFCGNVVARHSAGQSSRHWNRNERVLSHP